jgi:hypothetical protein
MTRLPVRQLDWFPGAEIHVRHRFPTRSSAYVPTYAVSRFWHICMVASSQLMCLC